MSRVIVNATSQLDAAGCGNDRTGTKPWPAELAAAFATGTVPDTTWAALVTASCPRFGRMDGLSRLSLLAVELLGVDFAALSDSERDTTGVCLETAAGSAAADLQFLQTASPSVFTYTLPSTTIGEICIRHRLRGPVLCLMTATADGQQAQAHARRWFATGEVTRCLCLAADALPAPAAAFLGTPPRVRARAWWMTGQAAL